MVGCLSADCVLQTEQTINCDHEVVGDGGCQVTEVTRSQLRARHSAPDAGIASPPALPACSLHEVLICLLLQATRHFLHTCPAHLPFTPAVPQVARCTKIINPNTDEAKYVINIKQIAKFVVGLGDKVAPTDIEEGMRVGVDRAKYQIQIPLPPKIDASVTMMTVEEKPDITYSDIGGSKEQIEKMKEVVEAPMLHPEKFVALGIDPPKGVLMYGPPGEQ